MVSCLVFPFKSRFLIFVFPDFKFCLLFNMNVFGFKTNNFKKHNVFVKRGVATKRVFFINLCFSKCEKLSFFAPFLPNFGWCSKNTIKLVSAHWWRQKIEKKIHFGVLLSGPSRCYYLGQVDCNLKMANLAQIITPQICARNFFSKKKCWNPYFIVLFDKQCFVKNKLGPDNNTSKGQTWPRS